jgi:hypothetical protein
MPLGVLTDLPAVFGLAGGLLWIVTYALVIRIGFRQRTYAIPMLAVALNVGWEIVYGVLYPPESTALRLVHALWLLLDLIILYQLYRFGRGEQTQRLIARYFHSILAGMLVLALVGHLLVREQMTRMMIMGDFAGLGAAYGINLVMSALFLFFLPARPGGRGISLPVAWTKFLGTAFVSLGNFLAYVSETQPEYIVQYRRVGDSLWTSSFPRELMPLEPALLWYMALAIALLDLIYLKLVYLQKAASSSSPAPAPAPS